MKGHANFQDMMDDLRSCLRPIGPTPPILMRAARLRDHTYHRTPRQKDEKLRVMSGLDAVHLATCLHVRDEMGVSDILFHTLDDGRGKNYEEKAVSLLSFNDYSEHAASDPDVDAVRKLPRSRPIHPAPQMV
jgi:hypothetical protein